MFTFGILADVQAGDKDTAGGRYFRAAFDRLQDCVDDLNAKDLAFTVQLGDLIEEGPENLDRALAIFDQLKMKTYHVPGNHDFVGVSRDEFLSRTGMTRGYYDFGVDRWRFVVLDTVEISTSGGWPEDSPNHTQARAWLERLVACGADNAQEWNGAISKEQLAWLGATLDRAAENDERVIVLSHLPVLAEASHPCLLLWNHDEVLGLLETSGRVAAIFCGHGHEGGYAFRNGIHHVTLQAIVEAPEANAYAVVDVEPDRIQIHGVGCVPDRTLTVK